MALTRTKSGKKPANKIRAENGVSAATASDVLTLTEAAAYLRAPVADVLEMVKTQRLPGRQVGTQWRFLQSSLQEWLKAPAQQFSKETFLSLSGVWKDDPYIDEMLKEIYKRRGRPMTEEEE